MSMALSKWKQYLPKIIWGIIGLACAIFLIRVAVWENNYYHEKEGSERAVSSISTPDIEVDETDVTEDDLSNYKVAADRPRFLIIEQLNVKARVLEIGINNKGELATPTGIFDAGWYYASSKPGMGGTVLIDGHNGGPTKTGIFKHTPELKKDDIIKIERGDGAIFNYAVIDNISVPLQESDDYMTIAATSPEPGKESLTIITCTGEWSQAQRTYLSRQFTRAVLVQE